MPTLERKIYLSATRIASWMDQQCLRRISYDILSKEERKRIGIKTNIEIDPTFPLFRANKLLFEKGLEYESSIYQELINLSKKTGQFLIKYKYSSTTKKFQHIQVDEIKQVFESPPDKTTLYFQVEIPIKSHFFDTYTGNIPREILHADNAILDVLFWDINAKTWIICDIKDSKAATNRHRFQIAFYYLILKSWLEELHLDLLNPIDTKAYVYAHSDSIKFPGEVFDILPFKAQVVTALEELIPRTLRLPINHHQWQLVNVCEKCEYYLHCKQDCLENKDISLIPFLSKTAKQYMNDRNIFTLEQASLAFKDINFGKDSITIASEHEHFQARIDILLKYLQTKSPQMSFLRKNCATMPDPRYLSFPIFIDSQSENLYGYIYAISLLYQDSNNLLLLSQQHPDANLLKSDKTPSKYYFFYWIMENHTDEEQQRILVSFFQTLNDFYRNVTLTNKRTHMFVFDEKDIKNIFDVALNYLENNTLLQNLVLETLQYFPPTEEFVNEQADTQRIWEVPYTVLSDVLRRTIILPVRFTIQFIQSTWYNGAQPAIKVPIPKKKYLREMSNQFNTLLPYDYWLKQIEFVDLRRALQWKVLVSRAIYWEFRRLNELDPNLPTIFLLYKAPLKESRPQAKLFNDPNRLAVELLNNLPIEKFSQPLIYFISIERMNDRMSYYNLITKELRERQLRGEVLPSLKIIKAHSHAHSGNAISVSLKTISPIPTKLKLESSSRYLLTSQNMANQLYSLSKRSSYEVILENTTYLPDGNLQLDIKISISYDGKIKHPLFETANVNEKKVLFSKNQLDTLYVLDQAYIDITSVMMADFLTSFAFLRLQNKIPVRINDLIATNLSQGQQKPISTNHKDVLTPLFDLFPYLKKVSNFNNGQKNAVNSAIFEPATLVWGPPGTGKTRVIAWATLLTILSAISQKEKFKPKIAIVAFTNRAIDNALAKLRETLAIYYEYYQEQNEIDKIPPIIIFRAKSKRSIDQWAYNFESKTFENIPWENDDVFDYYLDIVLDRSKITIVAGSVFQLYHLTPTEDTLYYTYINIGNNHRGVYFNKPREIFDLLIVDEASQLKVAEFFMASFTICSDGRLLVVGDDKQLPPIITGIYPQEFTRKVGSIYSYLKEQLHINPIMLEETYRFPKIIAQFPSIKYYDGRLYSLITQKKQIILHQELIKTIGPIFLEFLNPIRPSVLFTYTKKILRTQDNEYEAELVAKLTKILIEGMLTSDGSLYSDSELVEKGIGIICPHNAQINAIKAALLKENVPTNRIPIIDTVDRFQGQEREVIIVSYGVSDPDYAISEADFILSPNRFNVSITRPRAKCIVLMSENLLNILPEEDELLQFALDLKEFQQHFPMKKPLAIKIGTSEQLLEGTIHYFENESF